MEKQCPRCGKTFECRHDEVDNCWCMQTEILPDAMNFILDNYEGCLCRECIDELNRAARLKRPMRRSGCPFTPRAARRKSTGAESSGAFASCRDTVKKENAPFSYLLT